MSGFGGMMAIELEGGAAAAERARAGIPDGFLRLSIGIESAKDLIGDIEQALH